MIEDHNIQITEPEYRDLPYPSYSLLAGISKQGVDIVNGIRTQMFQLKFGSLVDDMCFEPSKLPNYFHGTIDKVPSGNPKKIIDKVLQDISGNVGDEQVSSGFIKTRSRKVTSNIADYQKEILKATGELGVYANYSPEKVIETLNDKCSKYFSDSLNARGKMLIKPEMWDRALVAANTLKTHPFTRIYFDNDPEIQLIYQYKFVQNIEGVDVKGMLDCLMIDHAEKKIYPVDLKTGENPTSMFDESFLLYKYYLQASLYRTAIIQIAANDPDLSDYTVMDFEFVYLSKMNLNSPLIWINPEEMYQAGMDGFVDRFGFKHKGIKELLNSYVETKSGSYGDYEKDVYLSEGRKMLDNLIKLENDESVESGLS